jgi:hypothetical protein
LNLYRRYVTELNECRVQLEVETREHARLRETHREVAAEAAAGRVVGLYTFSTQLTHSLKAPGFNP